jgi:hypothetical protein
MATCRPFTNSCFVEMSLIGSMHDVKLIEYFVITFDIDFRIKLAMK